MTASALTQTEQRVIELERRLLRAEIHLVNAFSSAYAIPETVLPEAFRICLRLARTELVNAAEAVSGWREERK